MIRIFAVLCVLGVFGCGAAVQQTTTAEIAYPSEQAVRDQRAPYAASFADAFRTYEMDVQHALTLPYHSEAEAEAVIRSMSSQRFNGLLDLELARHGCSRTDLVDRLVHDEAFYSELRARYHGRIERLAREVSGVRDLVAPEEDGLPGELIAELTTPQD